MKTITALYLFVHPAVRDPETHRVFLAKWEPLLTAARDDETVGACILSNTTQGMPELAQFATDTLGDRCVVDPLDNSDATKAIIADDVNRLFSQRGAKNEWVPYELWTSNHARRWTQGLIADLTGRGYTFDPQTLRLICFGKQWGGCLTKYSMLFAAYLGLTHPADVRADLSPFAGHPLSATFIERVDMDRHVRLFLFKLPDGRAMAQFIDTCRAVWEPPHIAVVPLDADQVDLVRTSPNNTMQPGGAAEAIRGQGSVTADVIDGIHPGSTTLIAHDIDDTAFRAAMVKAAIKPWDQRNRATWQFPRIDPLTMTPS